MKKLLALLLALVMLLSLAACGSSDDDEEDIRGSVSSDKDKDKDKDKDDDKKDEVEIGTTKNNTYKNEFAGIKCTLDSDWTFLTDEEIKANNETTYGLLGSQYEEAIKNASVFMDMMAQHSNGMDSVNVTIEKLSGIAASYTETEYAEASKSVKKSAFEQLGMKNVTLAVEEGTFLGEDHIIMNISGTYSGRTMYEKLALVKCGNYMVLVTACTWGENGCQDILDQFKPL